MRNNAHEFLLGIYHTEGADGWVVGKDLGCFLERRLLAYRSGHDAHNTRGFDVAEFCKVLLEHTPIPLPARDLFHQAEHGREVNLRRVENEIVGRDDPAHYMTAINHGHTIVVVFFEKIRDNIHGVVDINGDDFFGHHLCNVEFCRLGVCHAHSIHPVGVIPLGKNQLTKIRSCIKILSEEHSMSKIYWVGITRSPRDPEADSAMQDRIDTTLQRLAPEPLIIEGNSNGTELQRHMIGERIVTSIFDRLGVRIGFGIEATDEDHVYARDLIDEAVTTLRDILEIVKNSESIHSWAWDRDAIPSEDPEQIG